MYIGYMVLCCSNWSSQCVGLDVLVGCVSWVIGQATGKPDPLHDLPSINWGNLSDWAYFRNAFLTNVCV